MGTDTILLAETDPALLRDLPLFIYVHLPGIELTVCTSGHQAAGKLSRFKYSIVIAASHLLHKDATALLYQKRTRQALAPLLLTTDQVNREPVHDALLYRGAFDVIAKPLDPTDALASIKIALWQARFLGLLTQRERTALQLQRHLAAYPKERNGWNSWISKRVHDTLTLVQESMTQAELDRLDALFMDLAASVEAWTVERALDRLERMRMDHVVSEAID